MKENKGNLKIFETYGTQVSRIHQINRTENKWKTQELRPQYQSLTNFFMTAFLPHGYPNSVSEDYLQYQLWDSIQAFASSISGSICTHSVLKGFGVGDENATAIAATITWLLKDGVSMVGRIGFAWLQGTKLDSDCKKWRLFADIMNDAAMFLDLISSYFPGYFLMITCSSGLMKALVGVSGSCTRAALTQHQARNNNMADVSAKDGSQETLLNLLALFCSLVILPVVTKSQMMTWLLFFGMTLLHLFANYMAVKSVVMETLNEARFKIFASQYFKEGISKRKFLSVKQVNEQESVSFLQWPENVEIHLGSSIMDVLNKKSFEESENLLSLYQNCDYFLGLSRKNATKFVIRIAFTPKATALTHMEAYYQACYTQYIIENQHAIEKGIKTEDQLEAESRTFTEKTFQNFLNSLKVQKFNTQINVFNINSWRVSW